MRLTHFSGHFRETVSFCRSTTASIVRRLPSSSRLLCLSIPLLRPLVSTKSATLQTCSVALSFKWVFFSRVPVSLMDSARREIFGMVSWFDVFFPFTTCTPFGKCSCAPRTRLLAAGDVLRIVSTHSPAFHHGGLSGEIARFGISHLCVDLVLVIGDCALQLRATGKHIF